MTNGRRTRIGLVLLAALVCATQIVAWRLMLHARSNVIERNRDWSVMKREVLYHPSAYEDFLRTPISDEGVNLWLGQGYEGLRWNRPDGAGITRVETEARLATEWSYLHLMFRVGREGAYSILVSRNRAYPSGFYSFAPTWEAVAFEPLRFTGSDRPVRVAVAMQGDRFAVSIDGRLVQTFRDARLRDGTVAVKGGFFPAFVRRVEIARGTQVWADDFAHGTARGWPAATLALLAGFAVVLLGVLARSVSPGAWPAFLGIGAVAAFLSALQVRTGEVWVGVAAFAFFAAAMFVATARMPVEEQRLRVRRAIAAPAAAAAIVAAFLLHADAPGAGSSGSSVPRSSSNAGHPRNSDEPRGTVEPRGTEELSLGEPLVLTQAPLGEQRVAAKIRLERDSVVELRLWSPRFAATPEFRCSSQWHAVVLSTTPAIESGIYEFGAEPRLLAPLETRERMELRVQAERGRIRVFDGTRELASSRAKAASGDTALFLFAGKARVESAQIAGSATPGPDWRVPASLALVLLMFPPRRQAWLELLLMLLTGLAALALVAVARDVLTLSETATRLALWSVVAMQLAIAAAVVCARLDRRGWRIAVVAAGTLLVAGSLAYALLGAFSGPFHVVQLEMQNDVPPTPYSWLWYRHPSFRACNPFVQYQRFADRHVTPEKPPGTKRLVCIGASQTLGFGASSYDRTYPAAAARALADEQWEVINAGVPGSWTVTSRSWFEGALRHYRPDAVAINFCAADYIYLSLLALEEWDIDAMLRRIETTGVRIDPVTRVVWNLRAWRAFRAFRNGSVPDRARIERAYEATLERLVVAVKRSGAQPFVVLEPKTTEVSVPLLDYPRLYPVAQRVAERHGASVVDPSHAMTLAEQSGIVWWDYAHPTDFGYEVLGREVADAVRYGARP